MREEFSDDAQISSQADSREESFGWAVATAMLDLCTKGAYPAEDCFPLGADAGSLDAGSMLGVLPPPIMDFKVRLMAFDPRVPFEISPTSSSVQLERGELGLYSMHEMEGDHDEAG